MVQHHMPINLRSLTREISSCAIQLSRSSSRKKKTFHQQAQKSCHTTGNWLEFITVQISGPTRLNSHSELS